MAFVAGKVWHLRRGGLGKRCLSGFDAVGATGRSAVVGVAVPVGMGFVGGPVPGGTGVVMPAGGIGVKVPAGGIGVAVPAVGIGVEEPVVGKVVGVPVVTKGVGVG